MPEGGVISITCENCFSLDGEVKLHAPEGRYVKISIQDNGIGISAEIIEKIFDPYFSTKQHGSGLGLAITQSIINRHNGYLSVQSTPGAGATFTVYLPASEMHLAKQAEASVPHQSLFKARILVMDDEEMVRDVAKRMLVYLGHEVVLTKDGDDTVKSYRDAIAANTPFDLVIMDLTIPGGMGGKEAVKKILAINPQAKVVVSSGYSNDPILAHFKEYGFSEVIVKPYQLQELSRVLSQLKDTPK
jgi:CheY-like chemotaxis protein